VFRFDAWFGSPGYPYRDDAVRERKKGRREGRKEGRIASLGGQIPLALLLRTFVLDGDIGMEFLLKGEVLKAVLSYYETIFPFLYRLSLKRFDQLQQISFHLIVSCIDFVKRLLTELFSSVTSIASSIDFSARRGRPMGIPVGT
jgi:hypothetical protein